MNNKKCPKCGLVNFTYADVCKRCETLINVEPSLTVSPSVAVHHVAVSETKPSSKGVNVLAAACLLVLIGVGGVFGLGLYWHRQEVEAKRNAGREAIISLNELGSVVSVGVNLLDYRKRLADAKIKFDVGTAKYMAANGDKETFLKMNDAMQDYVLASQTWETFNKIGRGVNDDEVANHDLPSLVKDYKINASTEGMINKSDTLDAIWMSADAKTNEATQMLMR